MAGLAAREPFQFEDAHTACTALAGAIINKDDDNIHGHLAVIFGGLDNYLLSR